MSKYRFGLWCFGGYLGSVALVKAVNVFNAFPALRLPELLFLLLVVVLTIYNFRGDRQLRYTPDLLDYGVMAIVASQWLTTLVVPPAQALLSPLIVTYLGCLYAVGKGLLLMAGDTPTFIVRSIFVLGIVVVGSVAWSLVVHHSMVPVTEVLTEAKYLPGLGWTTRVLAWTTSPNMLLSLGSLPFLISLAYTLERKSLGGLFFTALLGVACLATWSKSLLLLVAVGLLLITAVATIPFFVRLVFRTLILASIAFWFISTKLIILNNNQPDAKLVLAQTYATDQRVAGNERWEVYQSMHYLLNKTAFLAWWEQPLFGIGPGRFLNHVETQKTAGNYPWNKPIYAPHSLYFGTLAQSGLVGFCALLFMLYAIWKKWLHLWHNAPQKEQWLVRALGAFLLLWLLDGLSMDTLHFRHFWWVVIVVAAWDHWLKTQLRNL